ncbi:MAG: nucleotidyl transferase AbiEii/AbiGii toxin family protein [Deltaproteobacteria bacterium]|nr:nucleotidyl transferase AbiEii/AbiGii toxin family protein [Deltaproteobacteria bacterium]
MSVEIIQERLDSYGCRTTLEEEQALREITQEIVLAALGRTDFFKCAGFQGGTCLRIFHGLNRFSEDMDFALAAPDPKFVLAPYLERVREELTIFDYQLEIDDRSKAGAAVQEAFVKDDSVGKLLRLGYRPRAGPLRKLRIKLEVDTNPPPGATYDMPVLDFPFPSAVRVFDLPSLFAGKIHALLCRSYLKGRDWYDFIWYTARRTPIRHALLGAALNQQGPWKGQAPTTDDAWCAEQLRAKIEEVDWAQARRDVQRFLKPRELPSLELWTREFFLQQAAKLRQAPR